MRVVVDRLNEAKRSIEARVGAVDVAVVLGSGLGAFADSIESPVAVDYGDIPRMPVSGVSGHAGRLVAGCIGSDTGKRVIAMQGRVHLYEGHPPDDVVFGVRLMGMLGAEVLIITNAAGGIDASFAAGDLMAITDQLNLTGRSLGSTYDERLGPRFVDMTRAFDPMLVELAEESARKLGFGLRRGVYAGLLGPAYETPAEVRMLKTLGADAVGMSTVLEVLAARQMGLRVLGLSCISNMAAGLSPSPLSHDEVKETAARVESRFVALLSRIVEAL